MTVETKTQNRTSLYYGQYQYVLSFYMQFSSALRSKTESDVYNMVRHRMGSKFDLDIKRHTDACLEIRDHYRQITQPFKRIISYDWQYVYCNDLDVLDTLTQLSFVKMCQIVKVNIVGSPHVVMLKKSQYEFRSYFSDRLWRKQKISQLANFLLPRQDYFKITPGLRSKLESGRWFNLGNYFVDHHHEQDLLLLNLAVPSCIRKTKPIVLA